MNNEHIPYLSISSLAKLLRSKELSPIELTRAYLNRIEDIDSRLYSYVVVLKDQALEEAELATKSILKKNYRGPLHGIPVAFKDMINIKGTRTSAGSGIKADFIHTQDATVVDNLRKAGAIVLGKQRVSGFPRVEKTSRPIGVPRNLWNLNFTAGGSSSGTAVGVSAALCAGALGSDTGGSNRRPPAFCNVLGLRPTYGRVSRFGVVVWSWDFDTVGPETRTVRDCALMLQVIAGRDSKDPSTSHEPVPDYTKHLDTSVNGLRVGLIKELFDFEHLDDEIRHSVKQASVHLGELGLSIQDTSLPLIQYGGPIFLSTADVDGAIKFRKWVETDEAQKDWNSKTRLEAALLVPTYTYVTAQRARNLIRNQLLEALNQFDVLLGPTTPYQPTTVQDETKKPNDHYIANKLDFGRHNYTSLAALGNLPCLTVPCGFTSSGFPVGMQIIGRPFDETTIFKIAHAYETTTKWHKLKPPI